MRLFPLLQRRFINCSLICQYIATGVFNKRGRCTMCQDRTAQTSATRRVLIAEDKMLIAMDLEAIVEEAGYAPVGPTAGLGELLRYIDEAQPHAALIDLKLANDEPADPALEYLKAKRIPFAVVTGNCDPHVLYERYGKIPIVLKPFSRARVVEVLSELLAAPA